MTDLFVFGTLRHLPLLSVVLGHPPHIPPIPAVLEDHAAVFVKGEVFPALRKRPGACAEGLLIEGLSDADLERLAFYEDPQVYETGPVELKGHTRPCLAFWYRDASRISETDWSFQDWADAHAQVTTRVAQDVMAVFGQQTPAQVDRRLGAIRSRAASYLRAQTTPDRAGDPRHQPGPQDVQILSQTTPYAGFFTMEEVRLRHRRFDGSLSDPLDRSAFVSVDVVTVLPYDPVRDRVLLIEQFRIGPLVRGDRNPWSLEAIAGRIDPGESPQQAALRETQEEANLNIDKLIEAPSYYTTPGAVSEYLYAFIGFCDLPDGCAGLAGKADEGEDIRAHLLEFDEFRRLLSDGVLENSPLILSGLWLLLNHQALRSIP